MRNFAYIVLTSVLFFCTTITLGHAAEKNAQAGDNGAETKRRPTREDIYALINAKKTGEWVYVGYNGEIIVPGKTLRPSDDCYALLRRGDETVIMDSYEEWEEYGKIQSDGRLVVTQAGRTRTKQAAAPTQWPFIDAKRGIQTTFSTLTFLARRIVPVAERPGPKGKIGCAVLLTRDKILRLPDASAYPENVLWILTEEDGGFRLEHSGPLSSGTYITVSNNQKITFGDGFVTNGGEVSSQCYWPDLESVDDTNARVCLPIGVPRSARGQKSPKFRVIWKNNEAVSTVVPHPAEL